MPTETHEAHISALVEQGWQRNGWREALRAKMAEYPWCVDGCPEMGEGKWALEEMLEFLPTVHVNPDAFRLVVEGEEKGWGDPVLVLELVEVEVTHAMSAYKLEQYRRLWWTFDGHGTLHFRLFRVDRYGEMYTVFDEAVAA